MCAFLKLFFVLHQACKKITLGNLSYSMEIITYYKFMS